ncbi:MAG: hypothetical protein MH252_17250 [Thermosynechococcaceae cyanobacterium MS004]|nr:hypothetical protein [Thermosynechococcaceae cyanobacterium MS004]
MNNPPSNLAELEACLQDLSHDEKAAELIRSFAKSMEKSKRLSTFNQEGALIRRPILHNQVLEQQLIGAEEDYFSLLQGDIVQTDLGYFLGERIVDAKFAIATSTCDLVSGRRAYAVLLRVQPIKQDDKNVQSVIGQLLKFDSTRRMYLPPLPGDPQEVVANAILFDGLIQIRLDDLLLASRYASLSLVGWRIFGSLIRNTIVRTSESEVRMRMSLSKA